jgi:CheY-like chemotaxis protein
MIGIMTFQSLLVSKDEQAAAVLTTVLSGFGLSVQCCGYPDGICRLTEQKFDAVIVDYDDPHSAALVLQNAYQASSGHDTVTVALLSDKTKVRNVFGAGANFVLYKPISEQQAQASLRAATALIKRERRRSFRVPVQVPVHLRVMQNGAEMEGILLDLSEDGLDVLAAQPLYHSATVAVHFSLPQTDTEVDVRGEVSWANPNGESGVRFVDLPENLRTTLRDWMATHAPQLPPEDPEPVSQCKLSDLSLGGCYVETESPFPERSGIVLCLKAANMEVEAEGMVRVMHPGFGMGIEFAAHTAEQRERVANFIASLTSRPGTLPQLLISPRALAAAAGNGYHYPETRGAEEPEDLLLELLRSHESLSQEEFLQELRRQRNSEEVASS